MHVMVDPLVMHVLHWDIVLSSVVLGRSEKKEEVDMNGLVGRLVIRGVVEFLETLGRLMWSSYRVGQLGFVKGSHDFLSRCLQFLKLAGMIQKDVPRFLSFWGLLKVRVDLLQLRFCNHLEFVSNLDIHQH
jgi:hypothetical protein